MRWPLRHQIMLPMAAIMLLTVVAVGGWGTYLAVRGSTARINSQIAAVTRTLEETNFPLTDAVLGQMQVLSGATLLLVNDAGKVVAASGDAEKFRRTNLRFVVDPHSEHIALHDPHATVPSLGSTLTRMGEDPTRYFHSAVELSRRGNREPGTLHILYPEEEFRRSWQRAIVPSLAFVVLALPVVMFLAAVTGRKIASRISQLQVHVGRIAEGDFGQVPVSNRDDEIRALGHSVNDMAAMLARYEQNVRRTERMRTLAQLGGGIAHQLRNSATGCGLALDLHARDCNAGDSESLDVAKRQLQLMETYLRRFLQLGKSETSLAAGPREPVDLVRLVDELLPLIEPAARHAGVELHWRPEARQPQLRGDAQRLNQLVINLVLNAIEAAAQGKTKADSSADVVVTLADGPRRLLLTVSDSGPGPALHVRDQLFEPFVSEKPDGVGLGLAVAREVAHEHGGSIDWVHQNGRTRFSVELPLWKEEFSVN